MKQLIGVMVAVTLLAGCEQSVQTTSGAEYLARYDSDAAAARRIGQPVNARQAGRSASGKARAANGLDPAIRKAAAVEPILRFPARIGLARIEGSELTGIPAEEAALWDRLARAYEKLGTFVPVDPLVARYAAKSVGQSRWRGDNLSKVMHTIRVGAARQHLDAVLIYAVGQRGGKSNTVMAMFDITIIGAAILPTREIEIEGLGRAILMDVRNGYPYGTASASVDLSEYHPSFGSDVRTDNLRREAVFKVTEKLVPEVDRMLRDLVLAMNARRARK